MYSTYTPQSISDYNELIMPLLTYISELLPPNHLLPMKSVLPAPL